MNTAMNPPSSSHSPFRLEERAVLTPAESDRLAAIWEAAVRPSHLFLAEEDIGRYREMVRGLSPGPLRLFLAFDGGPETLEAPEALGFMGLLPPLKDAPADLAVLFIHPVTQSRGLGRLMVERAAGLYRPLSVSVNEQNPGGVAFYRRCGFTQTGRSSLDDQGMPFPLLRFLLS